MRNRGKGLWVINGLATRVARALGLQNDGERLGLSPFQSEMRRRVWWEFISRDRRANEDYGLQSYPDQFPTSHVRLPLNVEDVDLFPDMKALPPPREGWTPMTHSLIQIHIFLASQKMNTAVMSASPPLEETRVGLIKELEEAVDKCLRSCNPVIPRQRLAMTVSRFLVRKVDFLTRIQWQLMRCPNSNEAFDTEGNLQEAMDVLESSQAMTEDSMLLPYAIPSRAYPQYSITLYILWYLCAHPLVSGSDRAWGLVNRVLVDEREFEVGGAGTKLTILEAIATKAKSVREKALNASKARSSEDHEKPRDDTEMPEGREACVDDSACAFPFNTLAQVTDVGVDPMEYLDWMSFAPGVPCSDGQNITYWG